MCWKFSESFRSGEQRESIKDNEWKRVNVKEQHRRTVTMALQAKLSGDCIPLGSPNDDRTPRRSSVWSIALQPIEECRRRLEWDRMMAARHPRGIPRQTVVLKALPNCDSELFRQRMERLRRNQELASVTEVKDE